jgi:hypothetical protein
MDYAVGDVDVPAAPATALESSTPDAEVVKPGADGDPDSGARDQDESAATEAEPVERNTPTGGNSGDGPTTVAADEVVAVDEAEPSPAPITPGTVPERGPIDSAPEWAKSEIRERGGDVDLNKDGCQFVAAALGIDTEREFLERAEETEFEYATVECTATLGERSATRTAMAHIDEDNVDPHDMNRMAETRAYKRAVKSVSGGGLLALALDEIEADGAGGSAVATDGGGTDV